MGRADDAAARRANAQKAAAPLTEAASWWRARWEVGHRIAVLDGVSALKAAGLKGFDEPRVHVSIPHGCRPYEVTDVSTHQVIDRQPDHLIKVGVPRTRVPVAALHASDCAVSDRQAALLLCLVAGIGGRTLLRLDLIGLRLTPAFMDQVCRAHARLSANRAS